MASYGPVRLAYKSFEPENGAKETLSPVIFLHSLTSSKESWGDIPQIVANNSERKAYTIDSRNHGDSEWNNYNFYGDTIDLIHFMDVLNVPKAVIVGHSSGGTNAINAALSNPKRVDALVVEDIYVKEPSRKMKDRIIAVIELKQKAVELVSSHVDEDEAIDFIAEYVYRHFPRKPEEKTSTPPLKYDIVLSKNSGGRYYFKANLDFIGKHLKSSEKFRYPEQGKYEGPVCFIYGKLSPFRVQMKKLI